MIYYHNKTGKFPHMIIEPNPKRSVYLARTQWIKENIGAYREHWISTLGLTDGKSKIYLREHRRNPAIRNGKSTQVGRQWCFDTLDRAMAFKLRWQSVND